MDFISELMKLLEKFPESKPEITKEVEDAYKAYGYDVKNPPSDYELAQWTTPLIHNWHTTPNPKLNLPLTGLCIAYNMVTMGKLDKFDMVNLKTLISSVYNMGYYIGKYNMRSPFDKKPQPQDLN